MADNHIRRIHGIQVLEPRHPIIRALRKAIPSPLAFGTQVWRSSFTLMDFLETQPVSHGCRVLEVGCGWGLAGIYCAKRFSANVVLTDLDERVFPYARVHGTLNGVSVDIEHTRMERLSVGRLGETDLMLGSDICFWPELGTALRTLIARALDHGVGRIVLADPGRYSFMRLADYCLARFPSKLVPWASKVRAKGGAYLLTIG